jgi:hypothetical protein
MIRKKLKWDLYSFIGLIGLIFVINRGVGFEGSNTASEEKAPIVNTKNQEEPKPQKPDVDVLRVSGTPNIPFSCAVMHGDMRQTTVDGRVPMDIKLEDMDSFGATSENSCQQSGAQGLLKVELIVDGKVVNSNETKAQYGIATVGNL